MQIIDTHQHLWDVSRFRYSWLKSLPSLDRSYDMQEYLVSTARANVVKSVHMEADVDEPFMLDETRQILRVAEDPGNPLVAVVACARPESKGFDQYLNQIIGNPRLKGIRRVLHTQPDHVGANPRFIDNVASLAAHGLSFDICVLARQLPVAINLVSHCTQGSFILDHCGVPEVKDRVLDPWRSHIAQLASFPNVFCKISGIVAYSDLKEWTVDDLRPYVEHVISCFGWDRVMFGSDWPVCTLAATYQQWVDTLKIITHEAGPSNQQKLFYDNAVRVYRLQ